MPLYQYECNKCGRLIEVDRRMEDRNEPLDCSCDGFFIRKWGIGGIVIR